MHRQPTAPGDRQLRPRAYGKLFPIFPRSRANGLDGVDAQRCDLHLAKERLQLIERMIAQKIVQFPLAHFQIVEAQLVGNGDLLRLPAVHADSVEAQFPLAHKPPRVELFARFSLDWPVNQSRANPRVNGVLVMRSHPGAFLRAFGESNPHPT